MVNDQYELEEFQELWHRNDIHFNSHFTWMVHEHALTSALIPKIYPLESFYFLSKHSLGLNPNLLSYKASNISGVEQSFNYKNISAVHINITFKKETKTENPMPVQFLHFLESKENVKKMCCKSSVFVSQ